MNIKLTTSFDTSHAHFAVRKAIYVGIQKTLIHEFVGRGAELNHEFEAMKTANQDQKCALLLWLQSAMDIKTKNVPCCCGYSLPWKSRPKRYLAAVATVCDGNQDQKGTLLLWLQSAIEIKTKKVP